MSHWWLKCLTVKSFTKKKLNPTWTSKTSRMNLLVILKNLNMDNNEVAWVLIKKISAKENRKAILKWSDMRHLCWSEVFAQWYWFLNLWFGFGNLHWLNNLQNLFNNGILEGLGHVLEERHLRSSKTDKHWICPWWTQSQVESWNQWTHCEIRNNGVSTKHKRTLRQDRRNIPIPLRINFVTPFFICFCLDLAAWLRSFLFIHIRHLFII